MDLGYDVLCDDNADDDDDEDNHPLQVNMNNRETNLKLPAMDW